MADLELSKIRRTYGRQQEVVALDYVNLAIPQGDFVAIEGESGSGKSSLLGVLGLLDHPTSGAFSIDGVKTADMSSGRLAITRSDTFAYIFQAFHLLERRPAIDSVALPLLYRGLDEHTRRSLSLAALAKVGLTEFAETTGRVLSGGQRQRVAIARALASGAPVLVADEPTGNLDTINTENVMDAVQAVNDAGTTVVLVTHSDSVARRASRRIQVSDGRIVGEQTSQPFAPRSEIPSPPGRASTVHIGSMCRDAYANLLARPGRLAGFIAAIAAAVALIVVTLGLSATASQQVTDAFDAFASREVTVHQSGSEAAASDHDRGSAELLRGLRGLHGVAAVAEATTHENSLVSSAMDRPAVQAPWTEVDGDPLVTGRLTLTRNSLYRGGHLAGGQALVGEALASRLNMADVDANPSILVAGRQYSVVGIVRESPREAEWIGAVLTAPRAGSSTANASINASSPASSVLITTQLGAAQQVAHEVPYVVNPFDPQSVDVTRPPDPSSMRSGIESGVRNTMILLTGVVLLGSLLSVTLTSLAAASERRVEFGLRRAVGARMRHIAAMLSIESAVAGVAGALLGLTLGLATILVVTIVNRWTPIFDLRAALLAVAAGVIVAVIGSLAGAIRAFRTDPNDTLRPHT